MKIIKPEIFEANNIQAGFTLSNRNVINTNGEIPGLNLGHNTGVDNQEIEGNIDHFLSKYEIPENQLAMASQVHGRNITYVTTGGIYKDTDALITDTPGIMLGIRVADCAALLLADIKNSVISAVHAGWRGAALGVLPDTIEEMKFRGADPESISAFISPCLSDSIFEVGEEVAEQFPSEFVDYKSFVKPHLDLKGFLKHQLMNDGVPEHNIDMDKGCTLSDNSFYSYRRERGKAGRMLGFIRMKL